jgi:hypothetical protein
MTKSEKLTLEAWNIWLIQNQLSTVNSDVIDQRYQRGSRFYESHATTVKARHGRFKLIPLQKRRYPDRE